VSLFLRHPLVVRSIGFVSGPWQRHWHRVAVRLPFVEQIVPSESTLLPKPVNRIGQLKAKAMPKYEQYNREKEQDGPRQDSNCSCDIDHTANGHILICHCSSPLSLQTLSV
jgi:hypothetical protein